MQHALCNISIHADCRSRPSPFNSGPADVREPPVTQHMSLFLRRVRDKTPLGCLTLQAERLLRAVSFGVASWAGRFGPVAISPNAVKRPSCEATEVRVRQTP